VDSEALEDKSPNKKYELQPSGCGDSCACHHVELWLVDEDGKRKEMVWESRWVSEPYRDEQEKQDLIDDTLEGLAKFGLTLKSKDFNDYWEWKCVKI
jgi:hypothetical protein